MMIFKEIRRFRGFLPNPWPLSLLLVPELINTLKESLLFPFMKPSLLLISLLFICSVARAEWHFEGRDVPAPSLENNQVGDACVQPIGVFLPPSYYESEKRYPVIYTLHGWGDGVGRDWYLDMLRDEWNAERSVEFIWVHLSGLNAFHGSFYTNSQITGNWGDFIAKDVVDFVDSNYRTLNTVNNRAITGHSMGGTGCLELGMHYPEVFSMVYALSPGLMMPEDIENWHVSEPDLILKMEQQVEALKQLPHEKALSELFSQLNNDDDWRAFFSFGYGMAYAGDPEKPFPFFDYIAETREGKRVLSPATLDVYRKGFGDLESKIGEHEETLKKMHLLAIDCGYNDGFQWIYKGSKYFSDLLDQHRISHVLILHQGDHGSMLQHQLMHSMIPLVTENFPY